MVNKKNQNGIALQNQSKIVPMTIGIKKRKVKNRKQKKDFANPALPSSFQLANYYMFLSA